MTKKFNESYEKNLPDPKKRRTPRDQVLRKRVTLTGPKGSTEMDVLVKPNEISVDNVNLFGMGLTKLPEEFVTLEFGGRKIDRIKTLIAGGNPLESLENLPPIVNTLNIKGHPKGGSLQSVAGSPDTKVGKLTLESTDITSLEGMPEVQVNFEFRSNNLYKDKKFTGLNVSDKMKSLPPEEILDAFGGGAIETNKYISREDYIKALETLGVEFQSVRGED